jgi:hypothetical protein
MFTPISGLLFVNKYVLCLAHFVPSCYCQLCWRLGYVADMENQAHIYYNIKRMQAHKLMAANGTAVAYNVLQHTIVFFLWLT